MDEKTRNNNCLEGMKCPVCGSLEPFDIQIVGLARFYDDGSDYTELEDVDWDEKSFCICVECGWEATVENFRMPE